LDVATTVLNSPLTGWGAFGALAILVVTGVVKGSFMPVSTVTRLLNSEIRRGDEWKDTALEGRKTIDMLVKSNEIASDFFEKVTVETSPAGATLLREGR